MTLTEFLLARIAEDEARAVQASAHIERADRWVVERGLSEDIVRREGSALRVDAARVATVHRGAEHIARWDPARVLAECDVKREIIRECEARMEMARERERIDPDFAAAARVSWATLRVLALPYAGHPDYREEWRP